MARALAIGLFLLLGGCGTSTDATRDLSCGDVASPVRDVTEVASTLGSLRSVQLGRCGEITYLDPSGDLWRSGADLSDPTRMAEGVASFSPSWLGDQLLLIDLDGDTVWLDATDGRTASLSATARGFARLGDDEVAWACTDGQLGTVEPEGLSVLVDRVLCDRVWGASQAPVLAFVGADDFQLHRLNLSDGDVLDLPDVPYVAAANDSVRLSRDGLVLYHQPTTSPTRRIAVFDLSRDEDDRLLGAPEVSISLSGIVEAPRAGRVAALPASDGVAIVTADGYLNVYPGGMLVSLSADGSRALLQFAASEEGEPHTLEIADLTGTTIAPTGYETGPVSAVMHAPDFNRAAFFVRTESAGREVYVFRWEDETLTRHADVEASYTAGILSNGGELLVVDDGTVLFGADGAERMRWPDAWPYGLWSVRGGGSLLVHTQSRLDGRSTLTSIDGDTSRVLFEGPGLQSVGVDQAGERLAYVTVTPDETDPTQPRSRLFAGAIPD